MPSNYFSALIWGPQGPIMERNGDDNWGPYLEETVAGNDDEDFIAKTKIIGKHAFLCSTSLAILDINLLNNRGGWPNVLKRLKYHYIPWLGGAVAYTATVCCVSALRGRKTDEKNHFIGGLATGAVIGKHNKSFTMGILTGIFLGTLGYWYKNSKMEGWEMIPAVWEKPKMMGHAFSHKSDFTTNKFPPRPGYWARNEEEVEKVYMQGQLGNGDYHRKLW